MEKLKERFLGKKVLVIADSVFDKNTRWVGICTFIGFNEYLKQNQVTINRTPVFVKDFSKVSLFVEPM